MKVTEVTTHIINSTWRNLVFVRVHTDAGIIGTGECTPVYGTGAMGTEAAAREIAAYHLVGRDPLDIEAFYDRAFRESFWGRNPGVLFMGGVSGLEQALWDITGKAMDVPVWRLLGGKCRDQLRLYANGWYMEARTEGKLQAYVDAAKRVVDDGFTAMKFDPFMGSPTLNDAIPPKHIDTFRDGPIVERVAAVREAVGPDVDIIVEVHGWLDVRTAIRFGQKFAPYAPMAYEEPIEPTNVDAMKKVSDRVDIPIASGERIYTRYGFREYIEQQALDIIQPDIGICGGIAEIRKIAAHAETYHIGFAPHNCNGPVATAATVHADFATTNFVIQEWFPYELPEHYGLVNHAYEPTHKDGYLDLPERPGLGVELTELALANNTYKPLRETPSSSL